MSKLESKDWGTTPDGTRVSLFTLSNPAGLVAKITNYGGIVTELWTPDRNGAPGNIVLGFDNLDQYLGGHPFFGAIAGRVANRIAGAKFTLEGREYKLAANDGPNHLHGGLKGFDKKVWLAKPTASAPDAAGLELSCLSKDGEEGYPGNLAVSATYLLTDQNELRIDYSATTDQSTPINLTNHSYFNLAAAGDVLDHEVLIAASRYTPVDAGLIPTGEIVNVKDSPLDFTTPKTIGARLEKLKPNPGGYDHNYVLDHAGKLTALAARVRDPKTGRVLEVYTTEPGLQLYTGNFLDGKLTGVGGMVYRQHSGLCLETQHFPDAVHQAAFPSIILRPGETYRSTTIFKLGGANN